MKDYKKILEGVVDIINATEKSDIGFVNICTYIGENCPELKESEDEEIRKFLIQMAQNGHGEDRDWWNKCVDWLEKQGEQKPAEWSKEDERNFDIIYGIIYNSCNAEDASRLLTWFKAIKDRVQPKPNQEEWSEEDIAIISRVISIVKWAAYSDHSHPILNDEGATELIDWLKSIRPQSKWSPSDEQMKALWNSIPENVMEISEREMLLDSLYQDLKKLL